MFYPIDQSGVNELAAASRASWTQGNIIRVQCNTHINNQNGSYVQQRIARWVVPHMRRLHYSIWLTGLAHAWEPMNLTVDQAGENQLLASSMCRVRDSKQHFPGTCQDMYQCSKLSWMRSGDLRSRSWYAFPKQQLFIAMDRASHYCETRWSNPRSSRG